MGQIRNALRAYAIKGAGTARGPRRPARAGRSLGRRDHVRHGHLRRARPAHRRGRAGERRPPSGADRRRRRDYVDAPRCPPLGFSDPQPPPLGRFKLAPGETLWLYTDGLIESRRRPLDDGLGELADAVAVRPARLDAIADQPAGRAARLARRRHRAARPAPAGSVVDGARDVRGALAVGRLLPAVPEPVVEQRAAARRARAASRSQACTAQPRSSRSNSPPAVSARPASIACASSSE